MWCFGIKNIAGFVLEKKFFLDETIQFPVNCEMRSVSVTQNQNIFKTDFKLFLNAGFFILVWIKPVLHSRPPEPDLPSDQPDQLPSKNVSIHCSNKNT